jgi:6-phosphogluconolactonase
MIRIYNDPEKLSQAAAMLFFELAGRAISERGRFSVVLSGGETPRRLYEILATQPFRERICWDDIHVFWSDERCVPEDDPRNNARMARQALLDHVHLPADHIHPIRCDQSPQQAALSYEKELQGFFGSQPPIFDLVLLGLGENGHTASLFPHTPVLNEQKRWVAEVYIAELDMYRVTLTAPLINQANQVIFLVCGLEKASVLQYVLEGAYQPHELPAQLIRPNGAHPIWLVDKAASQKLAVEIEEEL